MHEYFLYSANESDIHQTKEWFPSMGRVNPLPKKVSQPCVSWHIGHCSVSFWCSIGQMWEETRIAIRVSWGLLDHVILGVPGCQKKPPDNTGILVGNSNLNLQLATGILGGGPHAKSYLSQVCSPFSCHVSLPLCQCGGNICARV